MTAADALFAKNLEPGKPLRALAASGQLGYGIPIPAFKAGMDRDPHFIGCDMGSIDVGPYYLGAGKLATSNVITRRDLRLVLSGARARNVPLLLGTAGTAGADPHLRQTLDMIRSIAREERLNFRMAVIHADMPRDLIKRMHAAGRIRALGHIAPIDEHTIDAASHIVGQMGNEAFMRAMALRPDIIIAGRACDTAIFASIPVMLGYGPGPAVHMAKIIECTSICCIPGGRDAILGTLEGDDSFVLESMNPDRAATPMSVAAHSLYEQADPLLVHEPEGTLDVRDARFDAIDERRTRVSGARWVDAAQGTIKIEGAQWVAERAVLCAGSCDPRVIANLPAIQQGVRKNVDAILTGSAQGYEIKFHVYGTGATQLFPAAQLPAPAEIFFLVECLAPDADMAKAVASVTKQYLLHHGFPGRLSTGGNIAFPFTPPELAGGTSYRYSVYHVMDCDDLPAAFPIEEENIRGDISVAVA
jgi:hypothetical protein